MTLVIADTKAQADYWINRLQLQDTKYIDRLEQVCGIPRTTEIIAVGQCLTCYPLAEDLLDRGYSVRYRYDTR